MTAAAPEFDVVTIGECMVLFCADDPGALVDASRFTKRIAGAETNVAIGLARLGARVAWVSRVGADSFGAHVLATLRGHGVNCDHVRVDPERGTGFMLKGRAEHGEDPAIEYHRRGSAASRLSPGDFDEGLLRSARHLHVTGVSVALSDTCADLVERAMRFMRDNGRSVSFDPNLRPRLWPSAQQMIERINHFAALATWVLPGLVEGRLLTGRTTPEEVAAYYLDRGASAVVLKCGADGATFHTATESAAIPGIAVKHVVDTVGAGDGFAAGVIGARLEGRSWHEAVTRGNAIGACVIQSAGDVEGLPDREGLRRLQGFEIGR